MCFSYVLFRVLLYLTFMPWHAAKKTRSEGNASIVKSKTKEEDADGKQRIQKDEWKGKSKNKKGDSKLQNVQSQIEVPKGKLHSEVLVHSPFLHLTKAHFLNELSSYSTLCWCPHHVHEINVPSSLTRSSKDVVLC